MTFFQWYDSYSVHIQKIDNQHKKLIELINYLYKAIQNGNTDKEIGIVLKELVGYTKYHFEDEEKIMAKIGYPELPAHKKAHQGLIDRLVQILKKLQKEENISSYELLNFMREWLTEHIIKSDKKIGKYLAQKAKITTT